MPGTWPDATSTIPTFDIIEDLVAASDPVVIGDTAVGRAISDPNILVIGIRTTGDLLYHGSSLALRPGLAGFLFYVGWGCGAVGAR